MKEALRIMAAGKTLSAEQSTAVLAEILEQRALPEQVGAFLMSTCHRTPTGPELAGFALALRARGELVALPTSLRDTLVDVCGTGGDGQGTFNVSTTAALIAAAAGLAVAKHGNRAVSSRAGSFDVLEALSVPFADTAAETRQALAQFGIAFLYAPSFHPSFRALGHLRRSLGIRTVLNVLGPLLNPTALRRQVVGVYSEALVLPVAEALGALGCTHGIVAHGLDGADELSVCAPTRLARLENGRITLATITPEELGLERASSATLLGGNPEEGARLIVNLLAGERGPRRDAAILNAAAALVVGGFAEDLREGLELANRAVHSGRARALLERLRGQTLAGAAS